MSREAACEERGFGAARLQGRHDRVVRALPEPNRDFPRCALGVREGHLVQNPGVHGDGCKVLRLEQSDAEPVVATREGPKKKAAGGMALAPGLPFTHSSTRSRTCGTRGTHA